MRGISACRHGASFKEIGQRIRSRSLDLIEHTSVSFLKKKQLISVNRTWLLRTPTDRTARIVFHCCELALLWLFCSSEHAEKYGYGIDPFVGHGVGRMFHCEPIIWHTCKWLKQKTHTVSWSLWLIQSKQSTHGLNARPYGIVVGRRLRARVHGRRPDIHRR
jgi:methionine aminopeptidase